MADIRRKGDKWEVVSDSGDKKETYDTKQEAEKALRRWEGQKYHAEGKKPVRSSLEVLAKKKHHPDVKKKPNGKWTFVDDKGKERGSFDSKAEAVQYLRDAEGHEAHEKEPKGYKHKKKSQVVEKLVVLADSLDANGLHKEAEQIDALIKGIAKE